MKKLLLVGWDAADWNVINPLLEQGKMPALASLLATGTHGNLVTLDPPISPMLWTSIATGMRPYKHGIHGFTEVDPNTHTARPVRVTSRTAKAVWNILNDYALKTNVIGWWPSHPAEHINGVSVSNFFGVDVAEGDNNIAHDAIYPPDLRAALEQCIVRPNELTAEILAPFFPNADGINSADDAILRSVMRILAQTCSIHAAATYALEHTQWQFTAVYFDAIDHLCHLAMKYHPPKLEAISASAYNKYHYIVEAGYRFHDMMLERLIELSGDDCAVMLVSDHGFESGHKRKLSLPEEPGAPALEHNPYGIFLASGADFKNQPVYGASLLDITPTILAHFNIPVGQDMDGSVLPVFSNDIKHTSIPTHEREHLGKDNGMVPDASSEVDAQLLAQLEALGYIEKSNAQSAQTILAENQYYLARSYADGGQINSALSLMEKLVKAFPTVQRYLHFKANLYVQNADYTSLKALIAPWPNTANKTFYTGLIHLQSGLIKSAIASFDGLVNTKNDVLLAQVARAFMQAGYYEEATRYAKLAHDFNKQNHVALAILGEIALANETWEQALSYFFATLKLRYYQPNVHYNIGVALYWLGYYEEASSALKLALQFRPGLLAAHELLKEVLLEKLNRTEEWRVYNQQKMAQPICVVTGHPRSGTSMMMQMLQAGGVDIATDAIRAADKNNSEGYLELEAVKHIATDQTFLHSCAGKAVKIVIPLLRLVQPFYPLKVIWMVRNHTSTLKSQQILKGGSVKNAAFSLSQTMLVEEERLASWLNRYPHITYLKIQYEEALAEPDRAAQKIAAFLGRDFDPKAASAIINQQLNHH